MFKLTQGMHASYEMPLTDYEDNIITLLPDAEDIIIYLKKNISDLDVDAKVTKKMSLGDITIDTPITGNIAWDFYDDDTKGLEPGEYHLFAVIKLPDDDNDASKKRTLKIELLDGNIKTSSFIIEESGVSE